jgi:hypothetical protein
MKQIVSKQIYIKSEEAELLKQRAKELGVSEEDLVRQCIDQLAKSSATLSLDSKAWQEEMVYIREWARLQEALGQQHVWTREELYDERLQRFSR